MSQMTTHVPFHRPVFSARAVAVAAILIVLPSIEAKAHEPATSSSSSMSPGQMDHSKMEGMSMTGDVDFDFATNMRKHHQMALEMAEAETKNGKNAEMMKTAKNIITAQKKEIATFDRWLATHKKASPDAAPKAE